MIRFRRNKHLAIGWLDWQELWIGVRIDFMLDTYIIGLLLLQIYIHKEAIWQLRGKLSNSVIGTIFKGLMRGFKSLINQIWY